MDHAAARHNMVENQIRTNRVTDPLVIEALSALPREVFVPEPLRGIAYVDEDLALGNGRYLMEPLVLALLLQAAEIGPDDIVLEVGCATRYGAAAIARMAATVVALDSDAALAGHAERALAELDITNVAVVTGPLTDGYPRQGPYDVIVFGGAVSEVPDGITGQLAEGGRMVAVVSDGDIGRGTLFGRRAGIVSRRALFDAGTPILPGFEKAPSFVF